MAGMVTQKPHLTEKVAGGRTGAHTARGLAPASRPDRILDGALSPAIQPELQVLPQRRLRRASTARHSGMLPCFLGGSSWRLVRSISSARITLGRVSSGRITSST